MIDLFNRNDFPSRSIGCIVIICNDYVLVNARVNTNGLNLTLGFFDFEMLYENGRRINVQGPITNDDSVVSKHVNTENLLYGERISLIKFCYRANRFTIRVLLNNSFHVNL